MTILTAILMAPKMRYFFGNDHINERRGPANCSSRDPADIGPDIGYPDWNGTCFYSFLSENSGIGP
jgi:hypothetical protein